MTRETWQINKHKMDVSSVATLWAPYKSTTADILSQFDHKQLEYFDSPGTSRTSSFASLSNFNESRPNSPVNGRHTTFDAPLNSTQISDSLCLQSVQRCGPLDVTPQPSELHVSRLSPFGLAGHGCSANNQLELWAKDLQDRGDDISILEQLIPVLRRYMLGDTERRASLVRTGYVAALMTCIDTTLRKDVTGLLRQLTSELACYPANMDDTVFRTLGTLPIKHAECAIDCLHILNELTHFEAGKNSAFVNKVPQQIGRVLAACQQPSVVVPALSVLFNIATTPAFNGALLQARVFETFQDMIIDRLLQHLNTVNLDDEAAGQADVQNLLWKLALSGTKETKYKILRQVAYECGPFCFNALVSAGKAISEWSLIMQLCHLDETVMREAVRMNFFDSAYIILQYGRKDAHPKLVGALCHITNLGDVEINRELVNARVVEALLNLYPVGCLAAVLQQFAGTGQRHWYDNIEVSRLYSVIENLFCLIANALQSLPSNYDELRYPSNIVETLMRSNIKTLASIERLPEPVKGYLDRLSKEMDRLNGSWWQRRGLVSNTSLEVRSIA